MVISISEMEIKKPHRHNNEHELSPVMKKTAGAGLASKEIRQITRMYRFRQAHMQQFQQLSKREIEVLKLLANGCNNEQAAAKLFLSRYTIETHRKNIKRKLNIQSFLDLMRYAFAFNLIEC